MQKEHEIDMYLIKGIKSIGNSENMEKNCLFSLIYLNLCKILVIVEIIQKLYSVGK
jgi:hypothetical protein